MYILVPKFMEPKDPFQVGVGMEGFLSWELRRKGVLLIQGGGPVHNVITDRGLKKTAEIQNSVVYNCTTCVLGTGISTPVSTDIKLQAYGGNGTKKTWNSSAGSYQQGAAGDRWFKNIFEYGLTEAVGNWTEVGFCWESSNDFYSASGPDLFARVLFKDGQGNPITVQKTSEDTLTITYTLHVKRISDTPQVNTVNVPGVGDVEVESLLLDKALNYMTNWTINWNYAYEYKTQLGTSSDPLIPTMTQPRAIIGGYCVPTLRQTVNYVSGAMYREFLFEWSASVVGNIAEATYQILYSSSYVDGTSVACRFTPAIPKDNTKKFRLRPRITYGRISA